MSGDKRDKNTVPKGFTVEPLRPDTQVVEESSRKIRTFLHELAEGTSNYRSLHSLTEQVEHQYHRRFLVELIQNAHDALLPAGFALSSGNRWLPGPARALLDAAVEARNRTGMEELVKALGASVPEFVSTKKTRLRNDLNRMYQELGKAGEVPEDRVAAIFVDVGSRLTAALDPRVTPRPVYNRIQAPNLSRGAPDENWNQPLSLLLQASRVLRESESDLYFPRRLAGTGIDEDKLLSACNVFDHKFVDAPSRRRATEELAALDEIEKSDLTAREKCQKVWKLMLPRREQEPAHG